MPPSVTMRDFECTGVSPLSLTQLAALFTLGAMWGASYIFIRVAVEPLGPIFLMFIRVSLSGLILVVYARLRSQKLNIRCHWRHFLVLGLLGSALPFSLIAWAELTVTASLAAILMSTTPLFTTLVAALGLGEGLTPYKLIGALLGIVGVAVAVGGSDVVLDLEALASILALLLATLSYSLGGVYAKRYFVGLNNLSMSSGQMIAAALLLFPLARLDMPAHQPPAEALLAALGLVVLCTACAYQLYYYLIISAGPVKALTVTLLVPIFGVQLGALLLGESVSSGIVLGLLIVLFSVGLVTGMISPRRAWPRIAKRA